MLAALDQSYGVVTLRAPRLDGSMPLLDCQDLVVDYSTPDGESRRILNGLTLEIRQGQTIGIAGRPGRENRPGLRCVLRLIHPASGDVLVGRRSDRRAFSRRHRKKHRLRQPGTFCLFRHRFENIAYGCGDVTPEQIHEAAKQAHIHEEILQMPHGYETALTERGGNLSGGQRQRVSRWRECF